MTTQAHVTVGGEERSEHLSYNGRLVSATVRFHDMMGERRKIKSKKELEE
jgi:hypothetical protein